MSSQPIVQWNSIIYFQTGASFFYVLTISSNSFWKRLHNSKEIVNLQGLFVLTVGYLDMTTYPLTKYYYVIKRAYFIYKFFIFLLFTSTFSFLLFLYAAS